MHASPALMVEFALFRTGVLQKPTVVTHGFLHAVSRHHFETNVRVNQRLVGLRKIRNRDAFRARVHGELFHRDLFLHRPRALTLSVHRLQRHQLILQTLTTRAFPLKRLRQRLGARRRLFRRLDVLSRQRVHRASASRQSRNHARAPSVSHHDAFTRIDSSAIITRNVPRPSSSSSSSCAPLLSHRVVRDDHLRQVLVLRRARARGERTRHDARRSFSSLSRRSSTARALRRASTGVDVDTPLARAAGTSATDARARAAVCAKVRRSRPAERVCDSTFRARSRTRREVSHGGRIAHKMMGARWDLSTIGFRA